MSEDEKKKSTADEIIGWFSNIASFLKTSYKRMQNLEQSNFDLGIRHMANGDYIDAAWRFKFVCKKNPANIVAHYMQGKAYVYAGKFDKAIEPLEYALDKNPALGEAKFLLACCQDGKGAEEIPASLLIEHLDATADDFDENIAGNTLTDEALKASLEKTLGDKQGFDTLHLDCRTGYVPSILIQKSSKIVGIDPSLKNISKARDKRDGDRLIYNELLTKTSLDYLQICEQNFDIEIITNSCANYGSLGKIFDRLNNIIKPDGFVFMRYFNNPNNEYKFNTKHMLFVHSSEYINDISLDNGFEVIESNEISHEDNLQEMLIVLRKK